MAVRLSSVIALLASVFFAGSSIAKPATYEGADLRKAAQILDRYRAPEVSRKVIRDLQDWIDAEKTRRETQAIVNQLEEAQEEWRAASARMDRRLQEVIEQAERDSVYRAWAGFFRFVATTAQLAGQLRSLYSQSRSGGPEGKQSSEADSVRPPAQGEVMEVERASRERFEEKDGEWRRVESREVIYRHIFRPAANRKAGSADAAGGAALGSSLRGMESTVEAYRRGLAEAGAVPYCNGEWEGCVLVKEGGDDSWQPPGVLAEVPLGKFERPPTESEKGLYRTISGIVTPAEAGSLALDLTPIIGEAKSFSELITGTDPVTGEGASRMLALVGIVPVAGSKIKAGLKIAKISGKHLKASAQLENKWNFFVVLKEKDLSKLRKVEIDKHTNVRVDVIGEGTKEFKNGYVHFTTKSGASGIVKEGGIIARKYPDGSKKVHMLKRADDAKVLTRSQVDTGKLIGKRTEDAKAAIVTRPGNRLIDKRTLKSGAIEHRFDGGVGLEEGSLILMAK